MQSKAVWIRVSAAAVAGTAVITFVGPGVVYQVNGEWVKREAIVEVGAVKVDLVEAFGEFLDAGHTDTCADPSMYPCKQ